MLSKTLPGSHYPLGATWDGMGVNFAIFSEHATAVELCLFDEPDAPPTATVPFVESTGHIRHCYVQGLTIGQLYGYRVHGPYEPEKGLRFNPAKLLIDPYAKALTGKVDWSKPVFSYKLGDPAAESVLDLWGTLGRCVRFEH